MAFHLKQYGELLSRAKDKLDEGFIDLSTFNNIGQQLRQQNYKKTD